MNRVKFLSVVLPLNGPEVRRPDKIRPQRESYETLIVIHFRFLSWPDPRSFRGVEIAVQPRVNEAIANMDIAPQGDFSLYPDDDWNTGFFSGRVVSIPYYQEYDNAVRWVMDENTLQRSGIPTDLTVAMRFDRRDNQPFELQMKLFTTVGPGDGASPERNTTPMHFDPNAEAMGVDALPPGTDLNELGKVSLVDIGQIGPINSRETVRAKGYCQCGQRIP